MIITVTMNPAIDKTIEIDKFEHGGLNRINRIIVDAGGKGINVSKTIKALGGESLATGFLGGNNGELIRKTLRELEIAEKFTEISGDIRVNTKMVEDDGTVTELNEAGPEIGEEELMILKTTLQNTVQEQDIVILTGSVPKGVEKDIYKELTLLLKEKGTKVFVDADGELLQKALEAKPNIVKPNKVELERYFGKTVDTEEEILKAGKSLLNEGIETVIISLGAEGAYFFSKEHTLYSPGLKVKTHSTVGAGDAMVAAFSYSVAENYDFQKSAQLAMATSAGAVTTVGTNPPERKIVDELLEQVKTIVLQ